MKIDIPAFKHCFIGGTSLLTAYQLVDEIFDIVSSFPATAYSRQSLLGFRRY